MKIISVKAKNFLSYEELKFNLQNGFTLVVGDNRDEFDTNGSGKTGVLDSIIWGLYGSTLQKRDNVKKYGTKNCSVEIDLAVGSKNFKVVREIKGKQSPSLSIFKNGEEWNKESTTSMLQDELNQLIGMDRDFFVTTNIYCGKHHRSLAAMSDKEQKDLFSLLMDSKKWERKETQAKLELVTIRERINSIVQEANKVEWELESNAKTITDFERQLEELKEPEGVKEVQSAYQKANAELEKLRVDLSDTKFMVQELSLRRDNYLQNVQDMKRLKNEQDLLASQARDKQHLLKEVETNMASLEAGVCPMCKQTINSTQQMKDVLLTKNRYSRELEDIKEKAKRVILEYKNCFHASKQFNVEEYESLNDRLHDLEDQIDKKSKYVDNFRNLMDSVKDEISKYNHLKESYSKGIKDTESLSVKLLKKQKRLAADLRKEDKNELIMLDVITALGKQGVQNLLIRRLEKPMNDVLSRYMGIFGYKNTNIKFSGAKELKTGEIREKIEINFKDNEGNKKSYKDLSGGESSRVSLCFFLAIRDLFSHIIDCNFIALDEVLNNLDASGIDSLFTALHSFKSDGEVIALTPIDIQGQNFDRKLIACKECGTSTLEV